MLMSEIFVNWLLLITVFSVAVVSPGPDFVMVIRNSVLQGRKAGLLTAIGLGLGVIVHVTYTIAGLAALISKSILLFNVLKYAGAAYLIYVGVKALRSRGMTTDTESVPQASVAMSGVQALRSGFVTNLLNPKATMFFLALFSQIIDPSYSLGIQSLFGLTCSLMVMAWFSIVAVVLTTPAIKARFMRASKWIDRTCGAFFIALGVRLALMTRAA
jgi:RhtB (resistance to homoserine/threonine) family protein